MYEVLLQALPNDYKEKLYLNADSLAPAIVVSRYVTAERIINNSNHDLNISPINGFKQIVELGCGLSSHMLNNLESEFIQVDFKDMIDLRKEVLKVASFDNKNINNLIVGDVTSKETWALISEKIDSKKGPVAVLAEGLMMYLNTSQKKLLIDNLKWLKEVKKI